MNRNNILIQGHKGLGDHIICNAIYRHLALSHELVCIPVKYGNCPSVEYMLRDVPNIVIRPVEDDDEACQFARDVWKFKVLNIGCFGFGFIGSSWDFSFYLQAGVEYYDRWNKWACPRDEAAEEKVAMQFQEFRQNTDTWKIFLHEDRSRGLVIDTGKWGRLVETIFETSKLANTSGVRTITPDPAITPILFHWRKVIEHCDEIHCMSSSFSAFIDSIDLPKKPKLFLHQYVRGDEAICGYQKDWTVLK